jgi:hypothetical protein
MQGRNGIAVVPIDAQVDERPGLLVHDQQAGGFHRPHFPAGHLSRLQRQRRSIRRVMPR